MVKEISPEKNSEKVKGRLKKPAWRMISVIVVFLSISVLLYSGTHQLLIIPVTTLFFFLLLWFIPIIWTWIEEIFGKRPRSRWGRFSLNLVIAVLIASTFEDVLEILAKGVHILKHIILRWLAL
ncbi:MAG: hypothetical protein B6I38_05630 [Anaerolineaceae bacterium 4572_5.1]|nr:MAG: hypothetical protein B5M51_06645 [Anaerolinea sp. 4484_236]OQY31579.1 MAG: hypothetical protein B6I38_05630 [Anaerolineaceae bacterium 4572_5.1]